MFRKLLIITLSIGLLVGMTSIAMADPEATVESVTASIETTNTDNSNSRITNRQFVNPGMAPIPGTNGFFSTPTPDSSFRQIKELIYFLSGDENAISVNLTEGACEKLAAGGDVEANMQIVRARLQTAKADADDVRWITVSVMRPIFKDGKVVSVKKAELTVAGFATAEADDGDTNSYQVLGKLAVKAIKAKLDHLQITSEGAHRKIEASGWGIGFYTVGGTISDGGSNSGLVGGGTGYASNETGPEDRPWIQANVGLSM